MGIDIPMIYTFIDDTILAYSMLNKCYKATLEQKMYRRAITQYYPLSCEDAR